MQEKHAMRTFAFLFKYFFTNKDFLPPAAALPGTLFTPLHLIFSLAVLAMVILSAFFVVRRRKLIRPVLAALWIILLVLEVAVVTWESLSARQPGFDFRSNLSLYPCSIFLFVLPFAIWGRGNWKKAACGYIFTLGLLGGAVNFFYPVMRLTSYSCISFGGFHTFFYHGAMLFAFLVMLLSGYHTYRARRLWDLFLPCLPTLAVSIPANIVNYTLNADYMFFRGQLPLLRSLFSGLPDASVTLILYVLYIFVPAFFYLPSYLRFRRQKEDAGLTVSLR